LKSLGLIDYSLLAACETASKKDRLESEAEAEFSFEKEMTVKSHTLTKHSSFEILTSSQKQILVKKAKQKER
jgi:hypothetical protein